MEKTKIKQYISLLHYAIKLVAIVTSRFGKSSSIWKLKSMFYTDFKFQEKYLNYFQPNKKHLMANQI